MGESDRWHGDLFTALNQTDKHELHVFLRAVQFTGLKNDSSSFSADRTRGRYVSEDAVASNAHRQIADLQFRRVDLLSEFSDEVLKGLHRSPSFFARLHIRLFQGIGHLEEPSLLCLRFSSSAYSEEERVVGPLSDFLHLVVVVSIPRSKATEDLRVIVVEILGEESGVLGEQLQSRCNGGIGERDRVQIVYL